MAQHVGSVIGFAGDAIRCWFDDSDGAAAPRAAACAAAMQQVMGGLDGLAQKVAKLNPVIFVRYGRFTITNSSGFVTRRAEDVVRGLGVDLLRGEQVRSLWRCVSMLAAAKPRAMCSKARVTSSLTCVPELPPPGSSKVRGAWGRPGVWMPSDAGVATSATSVSDGSIRWAKVAR